MSALPCQGEWAVVRKEGVPHTSLHTFFDKKTDTKTKHMHSSHFRTLPHTSSHFLTHKKKQKRKREAYGVLHHVYRVSCVWAARTACACLCIRLASRRATVYDSHQRYSTTDCTNILTRSRTRGKPRARCHPGQMPHASLTKPRQNQAAIATPHASFATPHGGHGTL